MKAFFYAVALLACAGVAANNPAVAAPNASTAPLATGGEQHEARLLSAFFGLDNDLPFVANALCFGASGKILAPAVVQIGIDTFLSTQLGNRAFASQAIQDDTDLLLGGELATCLAADILDRLFGV